MLRKSLNSSKNMGCYIRQMATYKELRAAWKAEKEILPQKKRWGQNIKKENLTKDEMDKISKLIIPSNLKIDDMTVMFDFKAEREKQRIRSNNPMVASNFILPIHNLLKPDEELKENIQLDPALFGLPPRDDILHDVCRWYRARARTGNSKALTRGEVTGTGKKLRRQKGTGMARMSDMKSPHCVGGGVAHGPRGGIDWSFKINKKVLALGMRVALSTKFREGLIRVIGNTHLNSHRTTELDELWKKHDWLNDGHGYMIGGNVLDENFKMASSNLPYLKAHNLKESNVYDIINHKFLYLTPHSIQCLHDKLLISMMNHK